jgi:hypothetical protein
MLGVGMLSDGNLVVGEMFSEREKWIPDSFELRYSNGTFFLQLNFENPTKREVDCFNSGAIHLGLYVENGITFFLMHIAGIMDWSDQAFSIRLLDESEQNLPEAGVYYTPIHFILVNASNGKVASMRTVICFVAN